MNKKLMIFALAVSPTAAFAEDREMVRDEGRLFQEEQEAVEEFIDAEMLRVDTVLDLYGAAADPATLSPAHRDAARNADFAAEGTTSAFRNMYLDALRQQLRYRQ